MLADELESPAAVAVARASASSKRCSARSAATAFPASSLSSRLGSAASRIWAGQNGELSQRDAHSSVECNFKINMVGRRSSVCGKAGYHGEEAHDGTQKKQHGTMRGQGSV